MVFPVTPNGLAIANISTIPMKNTETLALIQRSPPAARRAKRDPGGQTGGLERPPYADRISPCSGREESDKVAAGGPPHGQ